MTSATTPVHWKLVIDAHDPHAQALFWSEALGYAIEDNDALIERVLDLGAAPEEAAVEFQGRRAWRDLIAVRHPDDPVDEQTGIGSGRRILFQRVPEPKSGKNRLHLDLHPGEGRRDAEMERLTGLGATVVREVAEPGGTWVVMRDPEGNEFCVQ
ncbi:VOC family protein [Streptomyces sp. NPDC058374]|uniref:VOC family protein n=1 Tax=unclassified Streptomyces TaxID=2593676 RepID=UPI003653746D